MYVLLFLCALISLAKSGISAVHLVTASQNMAALDTAERQSNKKQWNRITKHHRKWPKLHQTLSESPAEAEERNLWNGRRFVQHSGFSRISVETAVVLG